MGEMIWCDLQGVDECQTSPTLLSYKYGASTVRVRTDEIVSWQLQQRPEVSNMLMLLRSGYEVRLHEKSDSAVDAISRTIDQLDKLWLAA